MRFNELKREKHSDAIDGLKGISIFIIIIYYYFQHLLPGGFLAVNTFFVIGGFFAFKKIDNNYNFKEYINYLFVKINRMFFPLLFMSISIGSYILLFNHQYLYNLKNIGFSSLLFINNYYQIINKQSYFVQSLNPSPFIHLWYLSLYMQFIAITPVIKNFLYRYRYNTKKLVSIFSLGTIASLVVMGLIYYFDQNPDRVYYLLSTRIFAFFMGASLAVLIKGNTKLSTNSPMITNLKSLVIIVPMIYLLWRSHGDESSTYYLFMGIYGLLSTIILYFSLINNSILNRLLSLKVFTFLGKRSLSYYLWFYPIHLVLSSFIVFNNEYLTFIINFIIITILAQITYYLFETKKYELYLGQTFKIEWKNILKNKKDYLRRVMSIGYGILLILATIGFIISPESREDLKDLELKLNKTSNNQGTVSNSKFNVKTKIEILKSQTNTGDGSDVTIIGDSLIEQAKENILKKYPNAIVDGKVSRQFYKGIEVAKDLDDKGVLRKKVVTVLGTNGRFTKSQLDAYIDYMGTYRTIYFVTIYAKTQSNPWVEQCNQLFYQAAKEHKNVKVIDWYSLVKDNVSTWLYKDETHPKPTAEGYFINLIFNEIDK